MPRSRMLVVAGALLVLAAAAQHWVSKTHEVPLAQPLVFFPDTVRDWRSPGEPFQGLLAADKNADDALARAYRRDGTTLWLSVSYYRRQWETRRLLAAVQLEPGSGTGWIQPERGAREVTTADGRRIPAATMVLRRGEERYAVMYWYQLGDQAYARTLPYRAALLVRSLTERRSEGALVKVAAVRPAGAADPFADHVAFIRDVYPDLVRTLPR